MYSQLKKVFIVVLVALVYFVGVRGIRSAIHNYHMGSILPDEYGEINEDLIFYSQSSVSFTFEYNSNKEFTKKMYKIPFGMFFLFALVGLIFIGVVKQSYYYLAGIHFGGGFISFLALWYSIPNHPYFLVIPDMISRYLIPLLSLGLVALSYLQKKNSTDES